LDGLALSVRTHLTSHPAQALAKHEEDSTLTKALAQQAQELCASVTALTKELEAERAALACAREAAEARDAAHAGAQAVER